MTIRITNLAEFNNSIKEFSDRTGIGIKEIARKVALDAFRSVIEKTPVDTGWARNSWRFREGKPNLTVPKKPKGKARARNAVPPKAASGKKDFPVYYITNNLHYIKYLEAGRNKNGDIKFKTPNTGRMIQRTQALIYNMLKIAVKEVKR